MRKTRQAFPSLEQSLSHARGRLWVEIDDVIIGAPEPAQSGTGPNDAHALCFGRRNLLAPGKLQKPRADALMRHEPSRRVIRLGLGIEARLGGCVRLHIEDRLQVGFGHRHPPGASRFSTVRDRRHRSVAQPDGLTAPWQCDFRSEPMGWLATTAAGDRTWHTRINAEIAENAELAE
jgi:hypothetical protein